MARGPSSIVIFLRQCPPSIRQNFSIQIRKLTVETKDIEFSSEGTKGNDNKQHFTDIAKEVAKITRTKTNWEKTLLSDFPSFNFTEPQFFFELLKHQNNAFFSIQFFGWLRLHFNFVPDQVSCNLLFNSLLEAKASNAAKHFLEVSGFGPEKDSLERYICCLCEAGMVQDAFAVFLKFKDVGMCPSIATWNSALLGCLNARRTDLVWKLYHDMIESGVVAEIDFNTVEYLIRAFCVDGKVLEGYELLKQVMDQGLVPRNIAFNVLISEFCKQKNFVRVSELLHIMIAKNCAPDIYTYQEVINGLCKNRMLHEALGVFTNLKGRGYAPDRAIYTTMIHGLCKSGRLHYARHLWFEMISKGIPPNEYTYNALIDGIFKGGDFEGARKLYKEMCDRGYGETTASYNLRIKNLCLNGRTNEALELFEKMSQKGIVSDVISYNALITGFSREGRVQKCEDLLNELLACGLLPSVSSYVPLIEKLFEVGDIKKAKQLWSDMQNRGLKPMACDYDHFVVALCKKGYVVEGKKWLAFMLENKLRPQWRTFERLVCRLSKRGRLDDSLLVLDIMVRIGYSLDLGICYSLVSKLCKDHIPAETCLERILERN